MVGISVSPVSTEKNLGLRSAHLTLRLISHRQTVHGGVVSGFDFSCGVAVFSTILKDEFCSTVGELKVNYFKPLDVGGHSSIGHARVVFQVENGSVC